MCTFFSFFNKPFMGGQDAHPTKKIILCGTGILPVLENDLTYGRAGCPPHKKNHSLWNGHLARS
ncbi:MAG: hypothetical protein EAZ09_20405 [Oscillatoriales cyanobacterium]|nr:MAG: hypothetical protein EAZ09_20405 [Oscillatoriales cyanobacterium]